MFHTSQDSLIGKGSKTWTVFQIFEEFHAEAALKIQPRIKPLLKSIDCYNIWFCSVTQLKHSNVNKKSNPFKYSVTAGVVPAYEEKNTDKSDFKSWAPATPTDVNCQALCLAEITRIPLTSQLFAIMQVAIIFTEPSYLNIQCNSTKSDMKSPSRTTWATGCKSNTFATLDCMYSLRIVSVIFNILT